MWLCRGVAQREDVEETERLAILREHRILDTPPEQVFDDLTQLAAQICGTPIALISLVDEHRQWFKSRVGLAATETARDASFCAHAMVGPDLMLVPDALRDPRFDHNPLVTGDPKIRFYAGAPLLSAEGYPLGALCVIDQAPRQLSVEEQRALQALGRLVMTQLDLHRRSHELVQAHELIHEHERLDRALRASEHRWRTIFEAEPECVKILDPDGCPLEINPAGLAMIEADSFAQIVGKSVYGLVAEAQRAQFRALNEGVFRGESGVLAYEIVGFKGTNRWLETHAVPMRDELGTVTGALSVTRDISERRRSEDALRIASEERAALIAAIDGIVWEADAATLQFTFVSDQAERLLGYPVEQWTEPGFWAAHLHPEDRWAVAACVTSTAAGRSHVLEYRMVARDRRVVWLHDIVNVAVEDGRPVKIRGLMVEITERREAEMALRASSERYANQRAALTGLTRSRVLQTADVGAALREITETAARTLGVGRVSVWRFNHARTGIVCCDLYEVATGRHLEGMELAAATFPAYFRAIATSEVVAVEHAESDPRTCEFTESYLVPFGITAMLDAPIQVDGELDGVLCHEQIGTPRAWTPDEQSFAVSTANLVSLAIAQSERRQIEQRFRQSQKMEAFGQLAGGVAHDFNNLLQIVLMQAEIAMTTDGVPAEALEAVTDIELAAQRGSSLTRQLLAFSRRQVIQARAIDLNKVVTSLVQMLVRILGEDIRIDVQLHRSTLVTHADPGMIDQVLMNLVVNARDAMAAGGVLVIGTFEQELDVLQARLMGDAAPGSYVGLRVTDSGCGIPPDNLARIFEPFFTTKGPGKGTGLGLATVFGIVKQHRGVVHVESDVGRGTTVSVLLPAGTSSDVAPVEPVAAKPRGGSETILLVEDEPAVRQLTRRVLERNGYRVLEAASAAEALEVWGRAGRVDVLLTDMVMPGGLTGRELAAALLERDNNLKVIFTSGYSSELAGGDLVLQEGFNFVQKPCSPDRILAVIRWNLDPADSTPGD